MPESPPVPLDVQIACVKRELHLRASVYPRRIAQGRMTQRKATEEMQAMEAVLVTLQGLLHSADAKPGLLV